MYWGSVGNERFRARNDSLRAACNSNCMSVGGGIQKIPEGVHEGPLGIAKLEGEEVSRAIVSRLTSSGNGEFMGTIRVREVSHACPPRGGFAHDRDLARF